MAERRMFSKAIVESDAFTDMPLSSQALYFHLSMHADDEGFVGNPRRIRSMLGASEDDLKLLIAKRFILAFESGVVAIKHWKINNYLQNDRCKPTTYLEEKSRLMLDAKKAYTECIQDVYSLDAKCIHSIGEYSIDKYSIGESAGTRTREGEFMPPTVEEVKSYCKERGNNISAERFIAYYNSVQWKRGNTRIMDWKSLIISWEEEDKRKTEKNNSRYGDFDPDEAFKAAIKRSEGGCC